MVETEVTILTRTPFVDTTKPDSPQNLTRIVFQLPDGRVGDITIPTDEVKKPEETKKLSDAIKAMPANATERLKVDI